MKAIIEYFVSKPLFANLMSGFILISGVMSLFLMKREFFPNVNFEVIMINTVYPGASASDIEVKITSPLEESLQEIENVRRLTSISAEGASTIVVELDPDLADEVKAERDIQNIVDRFKDLPEDAEEPVVTALEFGDAPLLSIGVSGNLSDLELRRMARRIERDIERISGVARVEPVNLQDEEIRIEVLPENLKKYRVSLSEVISALQSRNISLPGGILEAVGRDGKEKIIRTTGDFESLKDIEDVVVRANDLGNAVRIKDVAELSWVLEKPKILHRLNSIHAVSLTVIKSEAADAIDLRDRLRAFIEKKKDSYEGVELRLYNDSSIVIENRLNVLSSNLSQGIFLVVLILTLFLSWRVSLLVSFSIPLSFLATVILFYVYGVSFNVVSLIGLIIVSGLLTDNAVVVVDNISLLMKRGSSVAQAAVDGTIQVWRSITASTLGIIIAFLPMLFMTGIFGKIVKSIPAGVIIALVVSLIVSFFILPAQFAFFVRDSKQTDIDDSKGIQRFLSLFGRLWDDKVVPRYRRVLVWIVAKRYWVSISVLILVFGFIFLFASRSKVVLFPADGIEIFYIDTSTTVGTPLAEHFERIRKIESLVAELPTNELMDFSTVVGMQSEGAGDPNEKRGDQYARIVVFLTPESSRDRIADEIIEDLRSKVGNPPEFERVIFGRVNAGPPVGMPISIGIRSESFDRLNEMADIVKTHLKSLPGTKDLQDSFNPGKNELRVTVNEVEAAAAHLTNREIARTILAAFEGVEATSIRKLSEEVHIRVQYPEAVRRKIGSLENVLIQNRFGNLIPLKNVATWSEVPALASIEHEGFMRQIKVTGDIDTDVNDADSVADSVRAKVPEWKIQYPEIEFFFGGEDQDTRESFAALGRAFLVAMIGIFLVLVLTFGKFLQPFLILLTVPFGAVSALFAFAVHGIPISFFGLLGIIALGGVIVNNAIVLIDFVNQEREAGLNRFESIYEAGSRRLRAIFLSTITNIIAVIPTAYGFGGEDKFVIPIAIALGWGLALGAVLTAVFFPAFLAVLDDIEARLARLYKR